MVITIKQSFNAGIYRGLGAIGDTQNLVHNNNLARRTGCDLLEIPVDPSWGLVLQWRRYPDAQRQDYFSRPSPSNKLYLSQLTQLSTILPSSKRSIETPVQVTVFPDGACPT
jgi:hypothetical protein